MNVSIKSRLTLLDIPQTNGEISRKGFLILKNGTSREKSRSLPLIHQDRNVYLEKSLVEPGSELERQTVTEWNEVIILHTSSSISGQETIVLELFRFISTLAICMDSVLIDHNMCTLWDVVSAQCCVMRSSIQIIYYIQITHRLYIYRLHIAYTYIDYIFYMYRLVLKQSMIT